MLSLAGLASAFSGVGFWASVGVTAILYFSLSTILSGASPGTHAADLLRHRLPALFAVHDRATA